MGQIIAVNLAHWRKRQEKRELQEKREYQGNVQEMIETTNQGDFEKFPLLLIFSVIYHLNEKKVLRALIG